MFLKKIKYWLCYIFFNISANSTEWTAFVHMEVSDNLSDVAIKTLNEMAQIGSTKDIKIKAQIHSIGDHAWRYNIEKGAIIQQEKTKLSYDCKKDLTDAARWAFCGSDSKYHMMILYGHAFGILQPKWDIDRGKWEFDSDYKDCEDNCSTEIQKLFQKIRAHHNHKAVLFHLHPKIYLSNDGLIETLSVVKDDILNGKKIDILGMDACMMSMIEVAYQVQPYAHYLVGSQDCESKDGWDYAAIMSALTSGKKNPAEVAESIVKSYDEYYKIRSTVSRYTQAAIDLSHIQLVTNSIDKVTKALEDCYVQHGLLLLEIIKNSRNESPGFCYVPAYTDVYRFYEILLDSVRKLESDSVNKLIAKLKSAMNNIKRAVIANCTGENNKYVNGLSIYFPFNSIDSSYPNTLFAKSSSWLNFLKLATN